MEFKDTRELANYLADKFNYKTYLELGTAKCETINEINIPFKRGVDINKDVYGCDNPSHMTTDEYFETDVFADIENNGKFDIVFIDGLHHSDQVDKDFENSLKYLSDDGIILMDDVTPPEEEWQIIPRNRWGGWTGDCWKSFLKLRCSRKDLFMCTVKFENSSFKVSLYNSCVPFHIIPLPAQ